MGSPIYPEPDRWRNFSARHLPSNETFEVSGTENWSPLARLTDTTLIIDIAPYPSPDRTRTIYWPSSGWRQAVDLPGDTFWSPPRGDGVFAYDDFDDSSGLYFLDNPDTPARRILDNARVAFPTLDGRIVYETPHEWGETTPLRVLMPDETTVELEPAALAVIGVPAWIEDWPLDTDEVLYLVPTTDGMTLRRTVLP